VNFHLLYLEDEEADLLKIAQLYEDVEEMREHFGFTGFKKCLMSGEFFRCLKKKNNGVEPSYVDFAKYLNEKIKWTSEKEIKKDTVAVWLKLDKKFRENKDFARVVRAAQALGGRSTIFDEPSKMKEMVRRNLESYYCNNNYGNNNICFSYRVSYHMLWEDVLAAMFSHLLAHADPAKCTIGFSL